MKYTKLFFLCIVTLFFHTITATVSQAEDVPIIIENNSSQDVSLAVSYHDQVKKAWVTAGWISIPAKTTLTKVISTGSLHVYYYAFNESGTVYQGSKSNHRDKPFVVSDAPFLIRKGQKPQNGTISTRYFKYKRANQRKIYFKF